MAQRMINKPLGALPLLLIGIILFILGGHLLGALGVGLLVGGCICIVASIVTAIGNSKKEK